jgi:cation transport ATPase
MVRGTGSLVFLTIFISVLVIAAPALWDWTPTAIMVGTGKGRKTAF